MKIRTRFLSFLLIPLIILLGVASYQIYKTNQRLVLTQAQTIAETVETQLTLIRKIYTNSVINELTGSKYLPELLNRYHPGNKQVPLPAEFFSMLSKGVSLTQQSYRFSVHSLWNINDDNGLNDPFLKQGFAKLQDIEKDAKQNDLLSPVAPYPAWPVISEVKEIDGRTVYRHLIADTATEPDCAACHSALEATQEIKNKRVEQGIIPGRSFAVNDLIGAIYIEVDMELAGSLVSEAITDIVFIYFLIALILAALIVWRVHAVQKPLEQLSTAATRLAKGDKDHALQLEYGIKDEIGNLITAFKSMTTERGKYEELILDQKQQYSSLFHEMDTSLVVFELAKDADGNFIDKLKTTTVVDANNAFEKAYQLDREELVGHSAADAFPEHEWEWIRFCLPVAVSQTPLFFGLYIKPRRQHIEFHAFSPSKGQFAVLSRDVTARIEADAELNKLRGLLKSILDSMRSAVISVDSAGNITQYNLLAEDLGDFAGQQIIAQSVLTVFPLLEPFQDELNRVTRGDNPLGYTTQLKATEPDNRQWQIQIYPLANPEYGGAVIRIDDITEQSRMEALMIQSDKMLSIGGLAAGMAHEINNPLAGMMQNIQIINNRLDPGMPRTSRNAKAFGIDPVQLSQFIEKQEIPSRINITRDLGDRAAHIVHNMLSFSRDSGEGSSLCDLRQLMNESIELASGNLGKERGYSFENTTIKKVYPKKLQKLECNAGHIKQVFLNILINALQAVSGDQSPVSNPEITVRLEQEDHAIRVEVEDNGPGISEEVRERVFEPFFTTRQVGDGTGLGLSIAYFIIAKNHGGEIYADNNPQGGARFTIRLPIKKGDSGS